MKVVIVYFILINIFTFFLYGIDKYKAIKSKKRIRELTFFLLSFLGGCFIGILAMKIFHHKTKKIRFYFINILCIIIYILILWRYYEFRGF